MNLMIILLLIAIIVIILINFFIIFHGKNNKRQKPPNFKLQKLPELKSKKLPKKATKEECDIDINKRKNSLYVEKGYIKENCINSGNCYEKLLDANGNPIKNSFNVNYPWCYYPKTSPYLYKPSERTQEKLIYGSYKEDWGKYDKICLNNGFNYDYKNDYPSCFNDTKNTKEEYKIITCQLGDDQECTLKVGGGATCDDVIYNYYYNQNDYKKIIKYKKVNEKDINNIYPNYNSKVGNYSNFKPPLYYKQFFKEFKVNHNSKNYNFKTNIVIPNKSNIDKNGYPYVLCFSFNTVDGLSYGWNDTGNSSYQGGFLTDYDLYGNSILNNEVFYDSYYDKLCFNHKKYMQSLKQLVNSGIALIFINEIIYDIGPYLPGNPEKGYTNYYWNNGNNYLVPYLQEIMKYIYNEKDEHHNKLFNYNRCSFWGYSLGAQLVSRMYNNFEDLYFINNKIKIKFPKISCGTMIGGGSLYCYSENDSDCIKSKSEPNYDLNKKDWSSHPPTLLMQYENDNNADPNASLYYFNVMNEKGVPCYLLRQEGVCHGITNCNEKLTISVITSFYMKWL